MAAAKLAPEPRRGLEPMKGLETMDSSLLVVVRFAVGSSTVYSLLRGDHDERAALWSVAWTAHETAEGEVLVAPPRGPEAAAELRRALSGAEGVTEVDVTSEYTLAVTNAPDSYDGLGTVSVSDEGDERVVAVHVEHLNWQAAHYASGIFRLQVRRLPGGAS
jgi:hypothetical protein